MNWTVQLCLAIKYIHSKKILHRDVKCQNIFITSKGTLKLGDFGVSKSLGTGSFAKTSLGTPYYLPPEVCSGHKYDYKADIWMLGCLVYELCTLKRPFEGDSLPMVMMNIMGKEYEAFEGYSEVVQNIIRLMLEKNPDKRITVEELLRIPQLEKIKEEIEKKEEYKVLDLSSLTKQAVFISNDNEEIKVPLNPNALGNVKNVQISEIKRPSESRKNGLTINTCFDQSGESNNEKAASTKSHLRTKHQEQTMTSNNTILPRHFTFSENLLDPQGTSSPNRPLLFTEFLRNKLGNEVFDLACNVLRDSVDPLVLLNDDPGRFLKVIGEKNAQYIKIFKYIMCSNVSTPVHNKLTSQQIELLQQHRSTQTPNASTIAKPKITHYQQNRPFSTRAQAIAGLKPNAGGTAMADRNHNQSPLNSVCTDVSN